MRNYDEKLSHSEVKTLKNVKMILGLIAIIFGFKITWECYSTAEDEDKDENFQR